MLNCNLNKLCQCCKYMHTILLQTTIELMGRYVSPVNPAVFPHLSVVLLGIGIFFTAWFFVYEVTSTKFTRDVFKELLVSLVAAIFMGFGALFLLLWVGIYVWQNCDKSCAKTFLLSATRLCRNSFIINPTVNIPPCSKPNSNTWFCKMPSQHYFIT